MKQLPLSFLTRITVIASLGILTACGGGGGASTGASTPPPVSVSPTTLTVGTINGFGSVIINGVRFDDSKAEVEFEHTEDRSGDDNGGLRMGMQAEVRGSVLDDSTGRHGEARHIHVEGQVRGPVTAVSAAATGSGGALTAMGVNISADSKTILFGISAIADLKSGDIVNVHGMRNTDGSIAATLIEKRTSSVQYRSTGTIKNLNTGAKTFNVGTLIVKYDDSTVLKSGALADGQLVRVRGASSSYDNNNVSFKADQVKQVRPFDDSGLSEGEVKGLVADLSADKSSFTINGVKVSVTSNTQFLRGAQSNLSNGSIVEAEGSMSNGTLVARKVQFEDSASSEMELELHGTISNFASSNGIMSFVVHGQAIRTNSQTQILLRKVSSLADGVKVEVKGTEVINGELIALRVKDED